VYKDGAITQATFHRLPDVLPAGAVLVFNNTRVIPARLRFRKETGAPVELFCLEPAPPHDHAHAFSQTRRTEWLCLVGNLRKWKTGLLQQTLRIRNHTLVLTAHYVAPAGDSHQIAFAWDNPACTFADVLQAAGAIPIPPYLHRETEDRDAQTYQTVYAQTEGSVAAPTAGLHFTARLLDALDRRGFRREEVTLHVGAGTFRPVQSAVIGAHKMHAEHFTVQRRTVERLLSSDAPVIAVGTTSARTLESLYCLGAALACNPDLDADALHVDQWAPYAVGADRIATTDALEAILRFLDSRRRDSLAAQTRLMIVPGYRFRIVRGLITNFHQPQSTLLLLVSAFVGDAWKGIYDYALHNHFRFLSYGDSSLLL
jgi:S-adenosylmethionine:tRNA ribosyltransferase-isomerase